MKKLSVQKLSLLGLVLMGASAVAAAILPSNKKEESVSWGVFSLTISDNNYFGSCTVTNLVDYDPCNDTTSYWAYGISGSTRNFVSYSNTTTIGDYE